MSRTYSHLPLRVIDDRFGEIEHDHINGVCDFNPDDPTGKNHKSLFRRNQLHQKSCKKLLQYFVTCYHFKAKSRSIHGWTTDNEYLSDPKIDYGHANTLFVEDMNTNESVNPADFYNFIFCHKDFDKDFYHSNDNGYSKRLLKFSHKSEYIDDGENFVYHSYVMTIRNESIECECDVKVSKIDRIASRCEKSADQNVVFKHRPKKYNSCHDCDYCMSPEGPTDNSVRMSLQEIAAMFNNGENVDDDDF